MNKDLTINLIATAVALALAGAVRYFQIVPEEYIDIATAVIIAALVLILYLMNLSLLSQFIQAHPKFVQWCLVMSIVLNIVVGITFVSRWGGASPPAAVPDAGTPLEALGPMVIFSFDGARQQSHGNGEFQSRLSADGLPLYSFKYTLPMTDTMFGFAGLAFAFLNQSQAPDTRDFRPYKILEMRLSFEPIESRCAVYSKWLNPTEPDPSKRVVSGDFVAVNNDITEVGGEPVISSGMIKTFRIPITTQLRLREPQSIIEIGLLSDAGFVRGEGACLIHGIRLLR